MAFDHLSFFAGLNPEQNDRLRQVFLLCEIPAETVLFMQGDPARHLYIVTQGEVQIRYKPEDGTEIVVARVRPEGVVGWSAALGSPAYTSSAVCAEDCLLLRVGNEALRSLCAEHPDTGALVLDRLAALVAERLRNTHHEVRALLEQSLNQEFMPDRVEFNRMETG